VTSIVISAGLSPAWRLLGGSIPPHLDAAALRAWSEPGWIKAGMEFRLEPVPAGTLLSTETRVLATDLKTRRTFAAYWFVIRPGSSVIRRDAREHLRTARDMLEAMGMDAFAERAGRELRATGETARKRTAATARDEELTGQEAQIARLAREGLSNPEIGTRLCISARTVQYHLGNIFAKLGIASRSELSHLLP
jgi:DNA-binding CsgD family transcriptional regulator